MYVLAATPNIDVPVQISEYAYSLGASKNDVDTLLGIAYAESGFNYSSVGDAG